MSADFDVLAKLTLDTRASQNGAQRMAGSLRDLASQLSFGQNMASGLVGRLLGVGAAYVGLSTGVAVFKSLTSQAVSYTSELEATRIGLQSVLSAVSGESWEDAGKRAEGVFQRLKQAAMKSPATTGEMFGIFQGIVGPIVAAGYELDKVEQITNDTVLAASALHVDFAQAQRDIGMMVRGAAGMDVKLFSLLRSTRAITESTEQWNKLSDKSRVEKLSKALGKYKQAGDAFGNSWQGVTSTFKDVKDEMLRAVASPIMGRAAKRLGEANKYLTENQGEIAYKLGVYGTKAADALDAAWQRATNGAKWVIDNWGNITRQIDDASLKIGVWAPKLAHAGEIWAKIAAGQFVAGKALSVGAGGVGLFGALQAMFAGGGGAAAATAATAATGAAEAGAATEAAAATGAAASSLAALGIAAVAVAAVGPPIVDNWQAIKDTGLEMGASLADSFIDTGKSIWAGLKGPFGLVGDLVVMLASTVGTGLYVALKGTSEAVRWFFEGLEPLSDALMTGVVPALREFMDYVRETASVLRAATNRTQYVMGEGLGKDTPWQISENSQAALMAGINATSIKNAEKPLSKQKLTVHNDFRGSRIQIDQNFRGDTDPDRVLFAMMEDLHRQAEIRTSSGYANAFSR